MSRPHQAGSPEVGTADEFAPLPANDFSEFIETYYHHCRSSAPQIEAIAGKWTFEDLMPGMSDFDTRFICANGLTADDWCRMSMGVSQVHLDLCQSHPQWSRILEHLPGINLTWDELTDEASYYPEYKQWTFYHSSQPEMLAQAREKLASRPWDAKDEYFHLKKFLTYYAPYNRSIDPAINLGPYENRYPLHSRLMHYFTPPLQSAVSILRRETVCGKMDVLRSARRLFPETGTFAEVIEIAEKGYAVPHLYQEPALAALEARLFDGLKRAGARLAPAIAILPDAATTAPEEWKSSLKHIPVEPALVIFDHAKWARLMKGRLHFYINAPSHFDNIWLIRNELNRIGTMFFRVPFGVFWEITHGDKVQYPAEIVPALAPDLLTDEEVECTLAFDRLTSDTRSRGREVETAGQIVEVFDGFFRALHKICRKVVDLQKGQVSG